MSTPEVPELDRALRLTPHPDQAGVFDAEVDGGWRIGGGVNGGLLLAVVGQAFRSAFADAPPGREHPDPLSVSAYYLSATTAGPARLRTEVLRRGRTLSTGQASLLQDDGGGPVERIRALATYGDLAALPDEVRTSATMPVLPPPEECVTASQAPPDFIAEAPFLERLDLRLDPATAGWAVGRPSGRGLIQGWLRLPDGREPDPLMLLLAVDALPPVSFDLGILGWAPTLELTVHVRARPAPGWLLVRHATRNFAGGLLEEDGEVWDSAGRLVAQSRQLARPPLGRGA